MSSSLENATTCFLSIVLPAYNEEERLPESLPQIIEFVEDQDYSVEVLIVDDGSVDQTVEVVKGFQKKAPCISLLQVTHGGKGHAVRAGMLQAKGEYLFLCDADLSMPIEEIKKFLPPVLDEYDVAVASREIEGSRRYNEPAYRHLMGRVFNLIVRLLAVRGLQDTQAGFKCFRREVAHQLFPIQTINGFGFDVELLFIAQSQGFQIAEVPINWYYRAESKVKPVQDTYNMLREILKVRLNAWRGYYPKATLHDTANTTPVDDSSERTIFSEN